MQNENNHQQVLQDNGPSSGEIITGANNEDRLDRFRDTAVSTDSESSAISESQPGTGNENTDFENASQDIDADNLSAAAMQTGDTDGANLGGTTNLSLDQLKAEADINN